MPSSNWIWLAVPIAALLGWLLARRRERRRERARTEQGRTLAPGYFRGLNYLLNEQPDKAIEVFVNLLDVDSETVETHLALGNLFRRRGEVDRAIRIHQNLIARPSLTNAQRSEAVRELGMDYMRAGLLDRAESLFRELLDKDEHTVAALRQLLLIYQQEQDWDRAIEFARKLGAHPGQSLGPQIAHFECEKADLALGSGSLARARSALQRALEADPNCVRATLSKAALAMSEHRYRDAIIALERVEQQDPAFLPEVFEQLRTCYLALDDIVSLKRYLEQLRERREGISPILLLAELAHDEGDSAQALDYLRDELGVRPSAKGLSRFVEYGLGQVDGVVLEHFRLVQKFSGQLQADRITHRCNSCGFSGRSLHWQCPGCKEWNTVKPIHGIQGE